MRETAVSKSAQLPIHRLYRAHIESPRTGAPELTVFVEAVTRTEAHGRVRDVCRALGYAPAAPDQDQWPYYNLNSGLELVETGLSQNHDLRLFETGWGGHDANADGVACWVDHPIFAVRNPAPLLYLWNQLPKASAEPASAAA